MANHISTATCRRIISEGIDLPAQRAPRLSEVARPATKMGWEYLLIDGVNIQTVCAPDGRLLWASAALPGKVNDITAARRHGMPKKIGRLLGVLAGLGSLGLDDVATGFRKPRGDHLTPAQRQANRLHTALRCLLKFLGYAATAVLVTAMSSNRLGTG
ncbi:MAG: hypothetical protein JXA67_17910 [Micromonosporaceae bacterium]|nr:hypothetical protein [Micromonosporaceae bacterium]